MENAAVIKEQIVKVLSEMGISVKNIILFGSMARGDFKESSDYDLLVILDKDFLPEEKKEIWYVVYKTLHKHLSFISLDIIIKSTQSFEKEKNIVNTISNEAYLEGIEV